MDEDEEPWRITITGCSHNGRIIKDPTGGLFTAIFEFYPDCQNSWFYNTMQKANIGRIYAAALKNVPRTNKRSKNGWADLARATGIINPKAGKLSKSSFANGISSVIFGMAQRGTLPKDPEQRRKLVQLAGSPWSSDPSFY